MRLALILLDQILVVRSWASDHSIVKRDIPIVTTAQAKPSPPGYGQVNPVTVARGDCYLVVKKRPSGRSSPGGLRRRQSDA